MNRIIYIAGSENTGTRFLSRIIGQMDGIAALHADGHQQDLDDVWNFVQAGQIEQAGVLFNSIVPPNLDALTRRSYPHGARPILYSIANLQSLADHIGRELVVIVTTRDVNMLNLSLQGADANKDVHSAFGRIKEAYTAIFNDLVQSNIRYAILNYETLMLLGWVYFRHVLDSLGIPVSIDPGQIELRDGNRKYLKDDTLPQYSEFECIKTGYSWQYV